MSILRAPYDFRCGVKKLSREQMKSGMERCRTEKTAHRQELCECLQKAGMKWGFSNFMPISFRNLLILGMSTVPPQTLMVIQNQLEII